MCWKKYITYKERDIQLQKVRQTEVRILMLKHVKEVIFESNEPRSLKCLLYDYNILLTNYNMNKITRVTTVKEMLQEEFGNNIGFHERIHKNKNIIVYNKADCGTFIDAALLSFGISGEQLIYNIAKWLHDKYRYSNNMEWPPYVLQLKDEGNLESVNLLVKLISCMKDPLRKTFENDTNVSALSDLLLSLGKGHFLKLS